MLYFTLIPVRSQIRPDLPPPPAAPCAFIRSWTRPAPATGSGHKFPGVREVWIIVQENRCLGCGHAIYIMDKVEMDEMNGLFCVDILVTLEIFSTEAVPRYTLYNEEGIVQMCLFQVPGKKG